MKKLLILLIILFAAACGGGSGGGGGSDKGVRLVHAVLDTEPVDFKKEGEDGSLETISFGQASHYFGFSEGEQFVQVVRQANLSQAVVNKKIDIEKDGRYTLLFHGNTDSLGLRGSAIKDNTPEDLGSGVVAVRIMHGLVGASALNASVEGNAFSEIPFGSASQYALISSESVRVSVSRAADGRRIATQTLSLSGGKAYSLLVTGETDLFSTIRILTDK